MNKVLLLTNILPPYRIPVFNALGQLLEPKGFKFKIAFMAEREENREWRVRKEELKVDYSILPGWHKFLWQAELPIHINPSIWNFLRRENPDVIIIGGYVLLSYWAALLYGRIFRKKLILWTSTTPECVKGRGPLRNALRRFFIRHVDAFVTYGTRASAFLEKSGVNSDSIFTGCNVGDTKFFRMAVFQYIEGSEFPKEKAKYDKPVLLYVGRFTPRKGIWQLLKALEALGSRTWSLIMVGSGPLQKQIEEYLQQSDLRDRVHIAGFLEKEDLVRFYAVADIFILPSLLDRFGIVVSEALASGLFTVVSRYAGAAWDLIEPGKNGLITDPLNPEDLRLNIEKAMDFVLSPEFSKKNIARSIDHLGPEKYAQAFVDAVKYALGRRSE